MGGVVSFFLAFLVHSPSPDSPLWEVDGDCPHGSASLPPRLMDLAKEMTKEALPIKCLEAVILGMYPSSALGGLGGGRHTLSPSGPRLPPLEGENRVGSPSSPSSPRHELSPKVKGLKWGSVPRASVANFLGLLGSSFLSLMVRVTLFSEPQIRAHCLTKAFVPFPRTKQSERSRLNVQMLAFPGHVDL